MTQLDIYRDDSTLHGDRIHLTTMLDILISEADHRSLQNFGSDDQKFALAIREFLRDVDSFLVKFEDAAESTQLMQLHEVNELEHQITLNDEVFETIMYAIRNR